MYLLDSNFLLTVTADLLNCLTHQSHWGVPMVSWTDHFPYHLLGKACFIGECEVQGGIKDLEEKSVCSRCSSKTHVDLSKMQHMLEHMGAHILYDSANLWNQEVQSTFSQCITPVPNFFYALWHFMQDKMCHKVWLSVTSAKNVTCTKSLEKTGKYHVFTWYQHSWERDYYWKKNWKTFVWLSSLEQCGAVPIPRNFEAFVHTSNLQFWTRVCTWFTQNGSLL